MGNANNVLLTAPLRPSIQVLIRRAYHDFGGDCMYCIKGREHIILKQTCKRMRLRCNCGKRNVYRDIYKNWLPVLYALQPSYH